MPDWGDAIDPATFDQILEMDDDDDREFSKNIVLDFFPQAGTTFQEMQEAMYDTPFPRPAAPSVMRLGQVHMYQPQWCSFSADRTVFPYFFALTDFS